MTENEIMSLPEGTFLKIKPKAITRRYYELHFDIFSLSFNNFLSKKKYYIKPLYDYNHIHLDDIDCEFLELIDETELLNKLIESLNRFGKNSVKTRAIDFLWLFLKKRETEFSDSFETLPLYIYLKSLYFKNVNLNHINQAKVQKLLFYKDHERNKKEVGRLEVYRDKKINFGKYKGLTINQIIDNGDVDYIFWAINSVLHFSIAMSYFLNESFKKHSMFFETLEVNLVKVLFYDEKSEDERKSKEPNDWYWYDDDKFDAWENYYG